MKIKAISLENIKSFDRLSLDNLHSRDIIVFAGENGSGKSTLFDVLNVAFAFIANRGWADYSVVELLKNGKDAGTIYIEIELDANEKRTSRFNDIVKLKIDLSRSSSFSVSIHDGVDSIRENLFDKRYTSDLVESDENVRNYGIFLHRSPYRYETPADLNEPNRNLLKLTTDRQKSTSKAQEQSSRWEVVLSYFLQLDRMIKSTYYRAKETGLASAQDEYERARKRFDTLVEDFNALLAPKSFLQVEESVDRIKYLVKANDQLNIEFKQLSSGEKEVMFLFADIRRQAPHNSIIAIDEPELHLHYKLQKKLVDRFQSLGEHNQIFLTTHSLGIVRQAEQRNAVIYYFDIDGTYRQIETREDFLKLYEVLIDDLAGILASEKVIFVEGENAEKDASIYEQRYIGRYAKTNFIASRDRAIVKAAGLLAVRLLAAQTSPQKMYCITDGDGRDGSERDTFRVGFQDLLHVLNRYSLESYFFDPLVWQYMSEDKKRDTYKTFSAAQFTALQTEHLRHDSVIDECARVLFESRVRLRLTEISQDDLKSRLNQSLINGSFLEIFPLKRMLGILQTKVFRYGSLDEFKRAYLKTCSRVGIPFNAELDHFMETIHAPTHSGDEA